MRNFPIDPHYKKIDHFCNVLSIDMTLQKCVVFIMGVYGGNLCLSSDQAEIVVPGYIKNVDTHHESFSSIKQVIKKSSPNSL